MYDPKIIDVDYGIQVIFSTIPNYKDKNFEDDIEPNYFNSYIKNFDDKDKFPFLYKPLKFYLLGDYDVCYISLINNFKFTHRLFEPKIDNSDSVYTHTFQSYSGFALNQKEPLKQLFSKNEKVDLPTSYFIGIIHIKLNNGLFIGTGLFFIELVYQYFEKIIKVPFILSQTFTWFELSLIVFIDNPKELENILSILRSANLKTIKDKFKPLFEKYVEKIQSDCLFTELKFDENSVLSTGLFSDTNSHFGFNNRLINMSLKKDYIDNYAIEFQEKARKIELKTEVKWHVKPGFINHLINVISQHEYLKDYFKISKDPRNIEINMFLGKCDYLIHESDSSILSNFHLIRDINRNKKCQLFDYVRKVKTYVFLTSQTASIPLDMDLEKAYKPNSWDRILEELSVKTNICSKIDDILKSLKVSRQIRIKVFKIFSNYNNGVLDPILFVYFVDFKSFIDNLILSIGEAKKKSSRYSFPLKEFEKELNENIKIFEEGYSVRFINGYQFENIPDFDLDCNNSIQQLLSAYGTLVYEYSKNMISGNYYPLIQLSDVNTVSNYKSINYYIHHLTSPEFLFATISKEIFNHIDVDNSSLNSLIKRFNKIIPDLQLKINESYFDALVAGGLFDIKYFINDALRYNVSYNKKYPLFEYWFWSSNLQNSSHYNSTGMFNELRLRAELFRLIFLKKIYAPGYPINCPIPELYTYWVRHFDKINHIVDKVLDYFDTSSSILTEITDYLKITLRKFAKSYVYDESYNLIYNTLISHYHKNTDNIKTVTKYPVSILRRNWSDGIIIKNYNSQYKDILYAIDQTGGVYFYNIEKMQDYFKNNADVLLEILDNSFIKKKDFIIKHLRKNIS